MSCPHQGRWDVSGVLRRAQGSERGAALLFALAAVLISVLLVGAIGGFCMQDNATARTQADSCAALDAAEAALHWELTKLSRSETDSTISVDQYGSPFTGNAAAMAALWGSAGFGGHAMPIPGTVTTYVMNDTVTPTAWTRPADFRIFASGTVGHATRSIVASGTAVGLADDYTLYGINSLTLRGGQVRLDGKIGSAGALSFTAPLDDPTSVQVVFDQLNGTQGYWADDPPSGVTWVARPAECPFPTVNVVAARVASKLAGVAVSPSNAIAYLRDHNDNSSCIWAKYSDGTCLPVAIGDDQPPAVNKALYVSVDNVKGKKLEAIQLRGNSALSSSGVAKGSNLYFEEFQVPSGQTLEVVNDAAYGPVRVWLGPAVRSPGKVDFGFASGSVFHVTDYKLGGTASPTNFQIYNATGVTFVLGNVDGRDGLGMQATPPNWSSGNAGFFCQVYAYNTDANGGYGGIEIVPQLILRGSLIGWNVLQHGGMLDASLPASTGSSDWLGWVSYYRLRGEWVETNTSGTKVDALVGTW